MTTILVWVGCAFDFLPAGPFYSASLATAALVFLVAALFARSLRERCIRERRASRAPGGQLLLEPLELSDDMDGIAKASEISVWHRGIHAGNSVLNEGLST